MISFRRTLSSLCLKDKRVWEVISFQQIGRQYSSFVGSKLYNPEDKVDFNVSKDPKEWKYVSRLLPGKYIPDPIPKDNFPSGWKPPSIDAANGPYYVRRSRNHMVPVYLRICQRGINKRTTIRHVLGDIWLFSTDLKKYIEDIVKHDVGVRVDEVGCRVVLRGDYWYYAQQFILEKGM
ncbi:large ribosomal subunit protein mL49 [Halyomorpha halys]|uniref:large ribosomal subunit protein mL49 n=1 Tax=Halyomorpha halys TaxID=286706 RepID=UPI0006D4E437|nr:probable 39S ribosomal protein L49, mitochondrial [Halyomorpha halys]